MCPALWGREVPRDLGTTTGVDVVVQFPPCPGLCDPENKGKRPCPGCVHCLKTTFTLRGLRHQPTTTCLCPGWGQMAVDTCEQLTFFFFFLRQGILCIYLYVVLRRDPRAHTGEATASLPSPAQPSPQTTSCRTQQPMLCWLLLGRGLSSSPSLLTQGPLLTAPTSAPKPGLCPGSSLQLHLLLDFLLDLHGHSEPSGVQATVQPTGHTGSSTLSGKAWVAGAQGHTTLPPSRSVLPRPGAATPRLLPLALGKRDRSCR